MLVLVVQKKVSGNGNAFSCVDLPHSFEYYLPVTDQRTVTWGSCSNHELWYDFMVVCSLCIQVRQVKLADTTRNANVRFENEDGRGSWMSRSAWTTNSAIGDFIRQHSVNQPGERGRRCFELRALILLESKQRVAVLDVERKKKFDLRTG